MIQIIILLQNNCNQARVDPNNTIFPHVSQTKLLKREVNFFGI